MLVLRSMRELYRRVLTWNAVFPMAFALLGVDIVLRVIVIETKTAKYLEAELELEEADNPAVPAYLKRSDQGERGAQELEAEGEHEELPDSSPEELSRIQQFVRNMPPVMTLLGSPRLLNALWATLMQAALMTSLETTVSYSLASRSEDRGLDNSYRFHFTFETPSGLGRPVQGKLSPRAQ